MEPSRIVDNVCEILTKEDLLTARELSARLAQRAIEIDKSALNSILYSPRYRRRGLRRDAHFRWSYEVPAHAEVEAEEADSDVETKKLIRQFYEMVGDDFAWEGVRRKDGLLFFFVEEVANGEQIKVIGPKGNVLVESVAQFLTPTVMTVADFSKEQIAAAFRESARRHAARIHADRWSVIRDLYETERFYADAYRSALSVRVTDSIPVDADIRHVVVRQDEETSLLVGPGQYVRPLWLVVDVVTGGGDLRHGVFKLAFYELVKKGLTIREQHDIRLVVRSIDTEVWLEGEEYRLELR